MNRLKLILYNKLTFGLALTTFGSLALTIALKFFLDNYFDINPVRGGLTAIDLSWFLSIAAWKLILSTLLELILGEKYNITLGTYNDPNSIISKMDKGELSSTDKGSTSNTSNNSSDKASEPNDWDKQDALHKEITSNIDTQYDMVKKLRTLKNTHDLKYYNNKGALELDLPTSISDEEAKKLSQQVGIIDRIYNTKRSELKNLVKQDDSTRRNYLGLTELVRDTYKNLFEK